MDDGFRHCENNCVANGADIGSCVFSQLLQKAVKASHVFAVKKPIADRLWANLAVFLEEDGGPNASHGCMHLWSGGSALQRGRGLHALASSTSYVDDVLLDVSQHLNVGIQVET